MSVSALTKRWPGREEQIQKLVNGVSTAGAPLLFVCGPSSTGKTSVVRRGLWKVVHFVSSGDHQFKPDEYVGVAPPQKPAKYIVVDHVERIADSGLLAVLLKAREITGANVGLILISSVSWGSSIFECDTLRVVRPMQLAFPAYEDDVLTKIIALGCPPKEDVESYVRFIGSYMYDFARVSRRLEDLQKVIQHLYPMYLQPVRDGKIERDNATALFAAFAPHFREAVANFTSGAAAASFVPKHHKPRADAKPIGGLDFELPYNSKLLLLAAYIASRNRPNLDNRLFDTGPGKRRRKNAMASDRQAEGAKEAQLRGPITFPQERLLSYFWNLLKSEGADDEAAAWDERAAQQQQSAEVFMLLRSLASGDMLDDGKYQCNIKDELAQKLAHNLQINLNTCFGQAIRGNKARGDVIP
ncbi:MAG: origin recognition complex subunit 5 [Trebouxia sp. A1-2]|nr:MAG: origin recognition complex subunit 5 [Trebouxia sp. A1-2]